MEDKKFFKNRRVLITGGLGFIGSNLALKLAELGTNITVLDSLLPDFGGNKFNIFPIKNRVNVKIADMRNQRMLEKIVGDFEIIFNLAGTLSHIDSMTNPLLDLDINCAAQLMSRSSRGFVMLSMCERVPARLKIISKSPTIFSSILWLRISAIFTFTLFFIGKILNLLPPKSGRSESSTVILVPSSASFNARLEPMKPKPPVIKTRRFLKNFLSSI